MLHFLLLLLLLLLRSAHFPAAFILLSAAPNHHPSLPAIASTAAEVLRSQVNARKLKSVPMEGGGGGDKGMGLKEWSWPSFQEAPAFRDGKECAPPAAAEEEMCDEAAVHVAMTLDANYLRGSMAAVLSILKHAACPEAVVFHFVAYPEAKQRLEATVASAFPYLRFHIYAFEAATVQTKISAAIRAALEEPLNYARAYLPRILPTCLHRVIYLDSDVIVLDDIARLWESQLAGHPLGAPEYCHANFTHYFTDIFWSDPSMSAVFHGRQPCYFNTGVMVMDIRMWRQWGFTEAIEEWMDVQKEIRIYELGSLPPFLLVFAGDVAALERRWNQHGLGGDNLLGSCRDLHPGPVSLLHWSGRGKPWVRLDQQIPCPLDSVWAAFDLAARQGGGGAASLRRRRSQ